MKTEPLAFLTALVWAGVALVANGVEPTAPAVPPVPQASTTPPAANAAGPLRFGVRAFGATGDGQANDTDPIQRTIDACAQQGGGVFILDRGTFLTGTLVLRSHVELHLTSTAVLQGVSDLAQYRADPKVVYKLLNQSLLFAEDCENVAITGPGTFDGQLPALCPGWDFECHGLLLGAHGDLLRFPVGLA
jgi:polygalacturonase